jgi:hypothetical protein
MSTREPAAAAEVAHAMSEGMNLLFLIAAPRVLAHVRGLGGLDREAALGSLRRFLRNASGIRARALRLEGDVGRLVEAAMIVEEIAGPLSRVSFEDPLPDAVVGPARRALGILGFAEPSGGWDDFEGFAIPYPVPPPSPRG